MSKEEYLGIYGVREPSLEASMPQTNVSGLWQAWLLPDGNYIVQPVDEQYTPTGDAYLLDKTDFSMLLSPVAPVVKAAEENARPPVINASDPALLSYWFAQKETRPASSNDDSVGSGMDIAGLGDDLEDSMEDALEGTPIALDERIFSPIPHPDEFFKQLETEQTTYSIKDFPFAENPSSPVPTEAGASLNAAANPSDTAGMTTIEEDFVDEFHAGTVSYPDEAEALLLETSMREEFALLMEKMEDAPSPELEQQIHELISTEGPFSWKQKFLFSELGLSLRKRRKHHLALTAHKRALALDPEDENVLFNIARTEYELGNYAHARDNLEKALAITPGFTSAVTFLSFLNGSIPEGEKHP